MSEKYTREQHLEMNRAAWDEGHHYLAERRKKNPNWLELFRNGGTTFNDIEIDLLTDVSGLRVLQLSCGGDASQALSFAQLGASVTACDFSAVAIAEAKENAAQLGANVRFVVDDSQRLTTFAEDQFDLVHVDGNLWYYEDLQAACLNWHRVLRPGGRLFLHENHPLTSQCLIEEGGHLKVSQTYGDKTPEYYRFGIKDFVSKDREAVEFPHTMADILNAIMQAGFTMKKMVECNADQASFPLQGMAGLPHDFFVIAKK